ncbi:hypothetical protein CVT24_000020 [Panaeolus cyanescens]|uniref:Uncharacterized protein n=1 Tax=Panaeolus cyanescens TaxID=181874 RepID=A0A409VSL4_9AGAR|nr:hypothetical protein CVT24_000020 [Panaeolus cyanescens]
MSNTTSSANNSDIAAARALVAIGSRRQQMLKIDSILNNDSASDEPASGGAVQSSSQHNSQPTTSTAPESSTIDATQPRSLVHPRSQRPTQRPTPYPMPSAHVRRIHEPPRTSGTPSCSRTTFTSGDTITSIELRNLDPSTPPIRVQVDTPHGIVTLVGAPPSSNTPPIPRPPPPVPMLNNSTAHHGHSTRAKPGLAVKAPAPALASQTRGLITLPPVNQPTTINPPHPLSSQSTLKRKRDASPSNYNPPHKNIVQISAVTQTNRGARGGGFMISGRFLPAPIPGLCFERGASVQVRQIGGKGSGQKTEFVWGEWENGVVVEYRAIGKWIETLDWVSNSKHSSFHDTRKWEYKVRVGSMTKGQAKEGWFRPLLGEIRRPPSDSKSSKSMTSSDNPSRASSSTTSMSSGIIEPPESISAEEAASRTMLWARFSNVFPREEAFRLQLTRWNEGADGATNNMNTKSRASTRAKGASSASDKAHSAIEHSSLSDSSADRERNVSSGSRVTRSSMNQRRLSGHPTATQTSSAQSSSQRRNHPDKKGKKPETNEPDASKDKALAGSSPRPYFADIWLPFRIHIWHEQQPKGTILLPCFTSDSDMHSNDEERGTGSTSAHAKRPQRQLASTSSNLNTSSMIKANGNANAIVNGNAAPSSTSKLALGTARLFIPSEYTSYAHSAQEPNSLVRFALGGRGNNEDGGEDDDGQRKRRRVEGKSKEEEGEQSQWLYDATMDRFVLVSVLEGDGDKDA